MPAKSSRPAPTEAKRTDAEALVFLPRMDPRYSHSVSAPHGSGALNANHCRHFGTIRLAWMAPIGFGLLGFRETAEEPMN